MVPSLTQEGPRNFVKGEVLPLLREVQVQREAKAPWSQWSRRHWQGPFFFKTFPPDFFPLPNRMKLALVLREIDSSFQVIMATNRADTLDPALLRPGRLDRKIEFPMPDRRQKRLVFATITSGMNLAPEVDLEDYVSRPDKISCADINAICQDVSRLTAIVGLVFRPQMRVGITRKTWPSRNVCRSKYSIVPRCSVTFWTHPEIIPVGQFFRRWIQSINQAQTFIVNLPVDWLIDDKLTLTWLVYWIRTARSVFKGGGATVTEHGGTTQ